MTLTAFAHEVGQAGVFDEEPDEIDLVVFVVDEVEFGKEEGTDGGKELHRQAETSDSGRVLVTGWLPINTEFLQRSC